MKTHTAQQQAVVFGSEESEESEENILSIPGRAKTRLVGVDEYALLVLVLKLLLFL